MDPLVNFTLPVSGMRDGLHQFNFEIGESFFSVFKESAYRKGEIKVHLDFDKLPSFYSLDFHISGTVETECDRCLELFDLPIEAEHSLKVKFDETEREEAEVVYVLRERQSLNVARFIYEFIHLSVPMAKTHDMADEACDENVVRYLDHIESEEPAEKDQEKKSSVWDALKNLNVE